MIDFYKYKIINLSNDKGENSGKKLTKKDIYTLFSYLQKFWRQ